MPGAPMNAGLVRASREKAECRWLELLNFLKAAWAECARRAVCIQLVARVVDIQVAHGQLADAI